jgi:hypothetical protein
MIMKLLGQYDLKTKIKTLITNNKSYICEQCIETAIALCETEGDVCLTVPLTKSKTIGTGLSPALHQASLKKITCFIL